MSAGATEREKTTVQVSRELHSRLQELKVYDSMSFDDLIAELADCYEDQQNEER